jgi:stage III sporulation protein AD
MLKIVLTGISCGILVLILKNHNKEIAELTLICSGLLILILSAEYLFQTVAVLEKILDLSNIDNAIYKTMLKIVGIGYLTEFSSSTLEDFGLTSLSKKTIFAGKIVIVFLSTPILSAFLEVIMGLL